MRKIFKIIYLFFCFIGLIYLVIPLSDFPLPPKDAILSEEPADTETHLRRAYFTNYSRDEVLSHYQSLFGGYLLNYPPEESKILIRDQTRSTFLQELVVPFKKSLFINGFEPSDEKDAIFIKGQSWKQKIIVKFVPSLMVVRIFVFILTSIVFWFVLKNFTINLQGLFKEAKKLWTYR